MPMTDEQQAQAERLHGAIAWVYPGTEDAEFWDQFFNQSVPELTPQEQASGISLGPYGPGEQQAAYEREQASLVPPAPQVLPPAPGAGASSSPMGGAGMSPMGGGTYNSSLIQALRQASPGFTSNNPGVTMMPNDPGASVPVSMKAPASGLTFNPPALSFPEAPDEVTFTQSDVDDLLSQAFDNWTAQAPVYGSPNDGGLVGGGN